MKKLFLLSLCSAAFFSSTLLAVNATINAGTKDAPANFSNPDAWEGGALPTFDASTNVILNGTEGASNYFTIDEDYLTVGSIKTKEGVDADYHINAEGKTINIDVAKGGISEAILFSNGTSNSTSGTMSIGNGTYQITSSATSGGDINALARIGTASDNIAKAPEVTKKIDIEAGAVINAYTKLALSGTIGEYSDINVFGEINTFAMNTKGDGDLIIYWSTNNYETEGGGGIRTRVNIEDGGVISTGNLSLMVTSQTNVKKGGTLNVNNALTWALSTTNGGGVLNSHGTTNINRIDFAPTSSGSGAMKVNVLDGTTTVKTVSQTYKSSSINVSGGVFDVTSAYLMDTGELNVSKGSANIANLTQTAGLINVTGATLNFLGTNTIASNDTLKSDASSTINFKENSDNTLGLSAAYTNIKGNVNFEKNSTLNANGTLIISNGIWNFDGKFVNTNSSNSNWQSMQFKGSNTKITFGENSTHTAGANNRVWIENANLIFNSATKSFTTSSFVLGGSAKLEFNKKNSVVAVNGNHSTSLNLTLGSNSTVVLRGTQQFSDVLFQGLILDETKGDDITKNSNLAQLTLDLQFISEDGYVAFSYIKHTNGTHANGEKQSYVNIYVNNFESNRIFLTDAYNSNGIDFFLYDSATKKLIDYELIAGTTSDGLTGYWVNIPEPAEWAAIFGGIALALAMIYRKRK